MSATDPVNTLVEAEIMVHYSFFAFDPEEKCTEWESVMGGVGMGRYWSSPKSWGTTLLILRTGDWLAHCRRKRSLLLFAHILLISAAASDPSSHPLRSLLDLCCLFLLRAAPEAYEVPRLEESELQLRPMPQSQQCRIPAVTVTYTTAHGKARSLTTSARPEIKPSSSQTLCQVLHLLSHGGNSWTYVVLSPPHPDLMRWMLSS